MHIVTCTLSAKDTQEGCDCIESTYSITIRDESSYQSATGDAIAEALRPNGSVLSILAEAVVQFAIETRDFDDEIEVLGDRGQQFYDAALLLTNRRKLK